MKQNPSGGNKARGYLKASGGRRRAAVRSSKPDSQPSVTRKIQRKPSPSVPAKNTGGAEKKSWGGWSIPKKVKPSKKTAAGVQRRSEQGSRAR